MPPHVDIHQVPPAGQARGYVRLAVMDGKTITHQVCIDQSESLDYISILCYRNVPLMTVAIHLLTIVKAVFALTISRLKVFVA